MRISFFIAAVFMPWLISSKGPEISGPQTPTQTSATIGTDGLTWTFGYSVPVSVGAGGSGGYSATLSSGSSTLTYSSGTGTSSLVYTGGTVVNSGITGTLAYTQPGNGIEATTGGIDLASFSGLPITNNSTQGGFSPPTGTFGWFKADSLSLSDGDPVGTWTDSSSAAHDVSNTGSARPAYHTNVQNSLPGVQFDGTNDYLASSTFAAPSEPTTFMFVVKIASTAADQYISDGTSGHRHMTFFGTSAANIVGYAGSFMGGTGSSYTDTNAHQVTVVYNGASSAVFIDGSAAGTGDVGSNDITAITLGATGDLGGFGHVTIFEWLARSGGRDTTTEAYMKAKWATP